jgi:hypothetical protein
LDVHPEFRIRFRRLWIPAVTLGPSAQALRAADRAAAIIIYFLLNWSACDCRRNVAFVERVHCELDDGDDPHCDPHLAARASSPLVPAAHVARIFVTVATGCETASTH